LGDGQVDFKQIFSKLATYGFDGWAVIERECAIKYPQVGAKVGTKFIREHIIRMIEKAFDDFATTGINKEHNRKILEI
jgi:hypothetical protein